MKEQSVRNSFGARKDLGNLLAGRHKQPGYNEGIIKLENPAILNVAKQIIDESQKMIQESNQEIDQSRNILKCKVK